MDKARPITHKTVNKKGKPLMKDKDKSKAELRKDTKKPPIKVFIQDKKLARIIEPKKKKTAAEIEEERENTVICHLCHSRVPKKHQKEYRENIDIFVPQGDIPDLV
jgi:hypothetical protein